MQDLIKNIAINTGISTDKASEVLLTVSDFIKEKYPLLAGTVDSVLDPRLVQKHPGSKE